MNPLKAASFTFFHYWGEPERVAHKQDCIAHVHVYVRLLAAMHILYEYFTKLVTLELKCMQRRQPE